MKKIISEPTNIFANITIKSDNKLNSYTKLKKCFQFH